MLGFRPELTDPVRNKRIMNRLIRVGKILWPGRQLEVKVRWQAFEIAEVTLRPKGPVVTS